MRIGAVLFLAWGCLAVQAGAATFGTVVAIVGEPSDLVLDEPRGQLYVVNSSQNRIEVYSTAQKKLLSTWAVDPLPISCALSRDGKRLYVTSYNAGVLDVLDPATGTLAARVSLPAAPEGVAVGFDERVLVSTTGTGTSNNPQNTLLVYDPAGGSVNAVSITVTAPVPVSTTTRGVTRSRLLATADGRYIVGLNNPSTSTRQVFVFEAASATVLRSRTVSNISSVLSLSPDGSRFMAGLSLFDTATLTILAQQNAANAAYSFSSTANFNTQSNQGGSVFSPDGTVLYTAFNIAPLGSTQTNASQMMLNDPENLLIQLGLQLPENLLGRMVISADGKTAYALSQSGMMVLPVGSIYNSPVVVPESTTVLVTGDQCGVTAATSKVAVNMKNLGQGRYNATAQVSSTIASTSGLAGTGGPGGGPVGGAIPIIPPGGGAPIQVPGAPPTPGGTPASTQTTAAAGVAPILTTKQTESGTEFDFAFNTAAVKSLGTQTPSDFVVQSQQAINIPPLIRVYQNNRNTESDGTIVPITVGASANEGLMDIVADNARQKVYIANSGLNRVEVFDMQTGQLQTPIKVGQLPHSLALGLDGQTLYVANTGGEDIGIVDLDQGKITARVKFPLLPFNASVALVTPSLIAAGLNGLQIVMSDGTLWRVINGTASPRPSSSVFTSNTVTAPRSMAATPGGEYILLLDGAGKAYLYDAASDNFVLSEQIVSSPIQGYYGPVAAGPKGQYYLVNGYLLNSTLTATSSASLTTVSAVSPVSAGVFARFIQPTRSSANATLTTMPTIQLVNATSGNAMGQAAAALEGPLSTQVSTQRANISPHTMVVNADGTAAYALTASGISVVKLTAVSGPAPPTLTANGTVNIANYTTGLAPGSLVAMYGRNLASSATASTTTLPRTLGGTCVTLDNTPIPLMATSATQINAQLPTTLTSGKHSLVVRSIDNKAASQTQSITVAKYAPAVFVDSQTGQAAVYHSNGKPVTASSRARRDEALTLYAEGLGATTGGKVTAGSPSPANPLAVTGAVNVYFGDSRYSQAGVIVEWSGLVPGLIGVYQINVRVPGTHLKGDALAVTISVGGVNSSTTAKLVPTVAVE